MAALGVTEHSSKPQKGLYFIHWHAHSDARHGWPSTTRTRDRERSQCCSYRSLGPNILKPLLPSFPRLFHEHCSLCTTLKIQFVCVCWHCKCFFQHVIVVVENRRRKGGSVRGKVPRRSLASRGGAGGEEENEDCREKGGGGGGGGEAEVRTHLKPIKKLMIAVLSSTRTS